MENEELEYLEENEEEVENDKGTKKGKEKKPVKQKVVSDAFTEAIKKYLDAFATKDEHFNKCYQNPNKNIVECCAYIVGQVMKQGIRGMADEEVYQLARHYYLEEISANDLQIVYEPNRVVTNTHVELSEEEKAKAKEEAIKKYQEECIKKEKERIAKSEEKKKKKQLEQEEQPLGGLFDMF